MKSRVSNRLAKGKSKNQRNLERKVFAYRIAVICEKMVGPGYFALIPSRMLRDLYSKRYPPLKLISVDAKLSAGEITFLRSTFFKILSYKPVESCRGTQLSYSWLPDTLLLIHYIEKGITGGFRGWSRLLEAFRPYFMDSEWFKNQQTKIEYYLTWTLSYLHDFYKGLLIADTGQLPIHDAFGTNCLRIYRVSPQITYQMSGGENRPVSRLGCYDENHHFVWASVSPATLGIEDLNQQNNKEFPVYYQQHMLTRFCERVEIPAGIAINLLSHLFTHGQPVCIQYQGSCLLEFSLEGDKLGYFVLSLLSDKVLIKTFLFITNGGTPEGERLATMTQLRLLDKQYLGIDRISGFIQYDIAGDEMLRKLFTKAGCSSLFRYTNKVKDTGLIPFKSAEFIHQYLGGNTARNYNRDRLHKA